MGHKKGNSQCVEDPASRIQAYTPYVPMCRASVGWHFRENKAVRSSYSKTRIMPYYVMFNRHVRDVTSCMGAWSNYYF